MKGKKNMRAVWPLVAMAALLLIVLISQRGMQATPRSPLVDYLMASSSRQDEASAPEIWIACRLGYAQETRFVATLTDALNEMRLTYRCVDIDRERLDLTRMKTLLVCTQDLSGMADALVDLYAWVEAGGRLGFMISQQMNEAFAIMHRKLGVTEYTGGFVPFDSLRYTDGLLPFWDDRIYDGDGEMADYTLSVRLETDCEIHITTGDEREIPLLWSRELGAGRIAVNNTSLASGKDARGYVLTLLTALEDVLCYPIINAGMMFIDDFPAPQPEGTDERLLGQFGYDIQGFFRNHWWPDMKELTWNDGLRYTGVLVETYNDNVKGPFVPDTQDNALLRYYASELLHSGGEIGLHGYNHMPLNLEGFRYSTENYKTWPTTRHMADAVAELRRYGEKLLPGVRFQSYVPPSNYLSADGQRVLLQTVPELRTISGLYLSETGVDALVQEFCEEADGSISVPRVTSGFAMNEYNEFVLANELALHGVVSHFIHPDDVLDDERGAALGWANMYAAFAGAIAGIDAAYPPLRWSTASEGAAAVQRYDRLSVSRAQDAEGMTVEFAPFYDEVWLALRTKRGVARVQGAKIYEIAPGFYWLCAQNDTVRIIWEADA